MSAASGRIVWVGRVMSVLVSLLVAPSSFFKLRGGAEVARFRVFRRLCLACRCGWNLIR